MGFGTAGEPSRGTGIGRDHRRRVHRPRRPRRTAEQLRQRVPVRRGGICAGRCGPVVCVTRLGHPPGPVDGGQSPSTGYAEQACRRAGGGGCCPVWTAEGGCPPILSATASGLRARGGAPTGFASDSDVRRWQSVAVRPGASAVGTAAPSHLPAHHRGRRLSPVRRGCRIACGRSLPTATGDRDVRAADRDGRSP